MMRTDPQTLKHLNAEQSILTGMGLDWSCPDRLSDSRIHAIKRLEVPQLRVTPSSPKEESDRVIRFVASDETPDRVGDVIQVSGWNLTQYKKNPVVLWGHDSNSMPPIGKSVNIRRGAGPNGGSALLASIQFAPKEAYEFADTVYQLTKAGFLNAVSVGFMPRDTKELTDKERSKLGMPSYGLMYTKADLLEISVVSVPANPSALVTGAKSLVDSGVLHDREVSRFLKEVPMNNEEVAKRLKAKIRGFVDLGAVSKEAPVSEAPEKDMAPEEVEVEVSQEAETVIDASLDIESPDASTETEERSIPADLKEIEVASPQLESLILAQAEQAKALTTLIDAISDLTKRIHSMGEQRSEESRGFATPSDAASSDAHLESVRLEKAQLEQLTTDFLTRLRTNLR